MGSIPFKLIEPKLRASGSSRKVRDLFPEDGEMVAREDQVICVYTNSVNMPATVSSFHYFTTPIPPSSITELLP